MTRVSILNGSDFEMTLYVYAYIGQGYGWLKYLVELNYDEVFKLYLDRFVIILIEDILGILKVQGKF